MGNIFEDIAISVVNFINLRREKKIRQMERRGCIVEFHHSILSDEKTINVLNLEDENYDYEDKLNKGDKK
ncbi:MAG: hypothetical protein UHW86_06980 [Spirochaetota bacterium]|nr:hypothetical protein [Spirochaetota bacterium]